MATKLPLFMKYTGLPEQIQTLADLTAVYNYIDNFVDKEHVQTLKEITSQAIFSSTFWKHPGRALTKKEIAQQEGLLFLIKAYARALRAERR